MSARTVLAVLLVVFALALAVGAGTSVAGAVDGSTATVSDGELDQHGDGVVAQNHSDVTAERTVNTTEPKPGEIVRATGTVSLDSERTIDYLDEFNPGFDSTELVSVTLNGNEIGADLELTGPGEVLVSVSDVGPGKLEFVYDVAVPRNATDGATYTMDGTVQVDGDNNVRMNDSQLVVTPPAPEFDVDLEPITDEVPAGENVTVEAVITNNGTAAGTQEVTFSVDGVEQTADTVTLAEGENETVSFEYQTGETDPPAVPVEVATEDDADTEQLTVLEPANFDVTLESIDETVVTGENVTLEVTVTNEGETNGTQEIRFSVDEVVQASEAVTLAGGASEQLSFGYETSVTDQSEIAAAVSSETDTITETVTVQEPASFEVASLSVADTVVVGESVTVEATVINRGETAGNRTVTFNVDGGEHATETVTVGPGEQDTVLFEYETGPVDLPEIAVTVQTEGSSLTETVTVQEPARFEVTLESAQQTVVVGEHLTVNATVSNEGDLSGTQTLSFSAAGVEQESTELSLAGQQSEMVSFGYQTTSEDPFELELAVATDDDEATETLRLVGQTTFAVSAETVGQVAAGENVTVAYTVENVGETDGTQTVVFSADGVERTRENLTLSAGEQTSGTYTYRTSSADAPAVVVAVESANDTVKQTVEVATADSLTVTELGHTGPVVAGSELDLTVTVKNGATVSVASPVTLVVRDAAGTTLDSFRSPVTVDPNGTQTVTATYSTDRNASPAVFVSTEVDGERRADIEVPVTEPPQMGPFLITLEAANEVAAGAVITANYTVENTGDIDGSQLVRFRVDGATVDSTTPTVAAGETRTGSFSYRVTAEDRPAVELAVASENNTNTVVVAVKQKNSSTGDNATTNADGSGPGFVPVTVLAGITVLAGYALVARLSRRETA